MNKNTTIYITPDMLSRAELVKTGGVSVQDVIDALCDLVDNIAGTSDNDLRQAMSGDPDAEKNIEVINKVRDFWTALKR